MAGRSNSSTGTKSRARIASSPTSTARKLTALTTKHTPTPAKPRMIPASEGPKMRDALKRLELSATAFGSGGSRTCASRALFLVQQSVERLDRSLDRGELVGTEPAQARREPGGAARADAAQHALALFGERQPDSPAVVRARCALDEPVALEPVDMLGHRGRRDTLAGGELAHADS